MKKIFVVSNVLLGLLLPFVPEAQLISNGGTIILGNDAVLGVKGNFSSNMPIEGNSKIELNGTASQQISMKGFSLSTLIINNPENVIVTDSVTVLNQLRFLDGKLIIDSNSSIRLNGTITGYSKDNYIVTSNGGSVIASNVGATPAFLPVGPALYSYTPLTIANTGTPDDFRVSVRPAVFTYDTLGNVTSSSKIDATWQIQEAVPGGSSVNLTLQWSAANEGKEFDRSHAYISQYSNGVWDVLPMTAAQGSNPYTLTRTGITSLSQYTVLSEKLVLPITLLNFDGQYKNAQVQLLWKTAGDVRTAQFNIERSGSNGVFASLGKVAGALNSATSNYHYTDLFPLNGLNVYRLKMIGVDGNFSYSKAISVRVEESKSFMIYPNPASDKLNVQVKGVRGNAVVQILDLHGRKIKELTLAGNGNVFTSLLIDDLPKGNYELVLKTKDNVQVQKFVKN